VTSDDCARRTGALVVIAHSLGLHSVASLGRDPRQQNAIE